MMGLLTCAVKGSTLFGKIVLPPPLSQKLRRWQRQEKELAKVNKRGRQWED